jgi:phosphate transport system permease protein
MKHLKKIEEKMFIVLMILSASVIFIALVSIIGVILFKGLPSLSWEIISQPPKGGYYYGKSGGVLNAILGSVYLSVSSTFLAFIFGLPVALFINSNLKKKVRIAESVRFMLELLWGVPSIVYGAFGFTIMIFFGLKASLLAGIITVTVLILPVMIKAIDEVMRSVPAGIMEASLSLGASKTQTAFRILTRSAKTGIISAILLSFGRSIGETASVLLTTGYSDHIATSLTQPTATLPMAIFFQLGSPIAEVQGRAYASAFILTIIVLVVSVSIRLIYKKKY